MKAAFTRTARTLILLTAFVTVTLIVIVLIRTFTLHATPEHDILCTPDDSDFIECDEAMLDRLLRALRFKTVSHETATNDFNEFLKLHDHIKKVFPTVHSSSLVTWEVVANYSLLYTIAGQDLTLTPYLLSAHIDVVPADPAAWEVPPFDGRIVDGFIYGRGTIDDKQAVFGFLEALEFALNKGHTFKRPFFIAIGHDEEVGGFSGAANIARLLMSRGVKLEFLVDEGTPITSGVIPGLSVPIAIVSTAEKGYLTVRISANSTGGHSSIPEKESCIGIISAAVARLEANPQPCQFGNGPERAMFEHCAPKLHFPLRLVMSNLWLFSPLVARKLSGNPVHNALIRTTTAVTEFHAGVKSNVIARTAYATINHRIHPAQTMEQVIAYDKQVISDDRIKYEVLMSKPVSPLSPYDEQCFGYQTIRRSIKQIWGDRQVIVAPGLLVGMTDSGHYSSMTNNIYRFSPTFMYPNDIKRFHGINERISVKNYEETVNFFYHLIMNADAASLEPRHRHGEEL